MPYQLVQDIFIYESSIWQTNSSVIINETANVVIDPCYFPVEIQVMADFVNRKKSFNRYVIFTHSDFDHIVGHQHFKGARLIGHESITTADREAQLAQLEEIDQTYYVRRKTPFIFPEPEVTFEKELRIPLKEDELLLHHAPGHTGDSIFIVSPGKKVMFAGDYLSDLEFPFVYFSVGAYRKSLDLAARLVEDFDVEYVVPGHGEIAGGKEEIFYRIDSDKVYLDTLSEQARELTLQGLQECEIIEVLKDIKYRGEAIEGAMARMHSDNIRQVLTEMQGR